MPWGSPPTDHIFGPIDEAKIALLTVAVDHMLDRCEETVRHTSCTLLCWLRSANPQVRYPKPFTLVAPKSSRRKYRQLLKRFFALAFRAYRMPLNTRRCSTGIRFKKEQLRQMVDGPDHEWAENEGKDEDEGVEYEDESVEEEEEEEADENEDDKDTEDGVERAPENDIPKRRRVDDAGSAVDELLELVFQSSITFSTEKFVDSQPSSSLLVYFSGILGFSVDGQSFLPAKKYTPHLSAFIYIQRLLFLEHALPLRPYPHLGIPRRSLSPLEEFQSLRDFGRVIACTDPPFFLLR
ncbi:hypothetical protein B0O99DRAFT_659955 [Bisporella sp. PMI_857]|nr:hypothetical protein B0O99DRAFT_659955 [Bisporella sp. PMI_857]